MDRGPSSSARMDVAHPTNHHVQRVSFHLLSPEQIRKLSVKTITSSEIFDQLNHPIRGGLYDPALGPIDKNARCTTCGLGSFQCPGHFGHIELSVPVYAPLTFTQMFQVLRQTCLYCHRFRVGPLKSQLCSMKLQLLDAGYLSEAKDLESLIHQRSSLDEDHRGPDLEGVLLKLRMHVHSLLALARTKGYVRGKGTKNSAVSDYRQKVIAEFLKRSATTTNVCHYCRGYIPAVYRHGGVKIFINPLKKNLQAAMEAKGMDSERLFKQGPKEDAGLSGGSDGEDDEEHGRRKPSEQEAATKGMKFLTPMHIYEHLALLWKNEDSLLQLIFGSQITHRSISPVDHRIFFTEVLAVPPCRFRPPSVFGNEQYDHPQNVYFREIIRLSQQIVALRTEMKSSSKMDKIDMEKVSSKAPGFAELIRTWVTLQEQVNFLFDSSRNTQSVGKMPPPGIKQILEKKEGLFRKHMMGKRVNYAARSVISPDPNIGTSEIGVPMVFAKKLTYPEPVTEFNVQDLRQAVINGPEVHPGASFVQMEDGTLANLESMSKAARVALANQLQTPSSSTLTSEEPHICGKKVMRHVRNGDVVLMNRQPTLHKPSIMAHRVRILPGEKTLRMHYANCNTYNADFDGDEMNLHFPQNELARAEAYTIANTNNQYLVPTDGSPLRGLIQDHVVTGVLLTLKDTFISRDTYQQLLFGSLPETGTPILAIPPAIVRPVPLWSGKQVVTTVLANLAQGRAPISVSSNCKISAKMWGKSHESEARVVVQDGYLVSGVVDKSQFGASAYGITHAVYELYGPDDAGNLLTTMGRLLTKYDQVAGFTCRMDDLLLEAAADGRRRDLIAASHSVGRKVVSEYSKVNADDVDEVRDAFERITRVDELMRGLDAAMKGKMNELTSKIIDTCLPDGQHRLFPLNNMSLMTLSGAKGSMVNFSQIAGLLGQQELEGRRVPIMVSGKSLPSFPAFDPRARAGGYITQRFLTGIRPQEFFFHCMAGREGLIDTAVKTSRSGYLQRCLIKHLESLKVHYDNTVRDSDGSILQFYYGEDGLDVVKQKYLRNFSFASQNFDLVAAQCRPEVALEMIDTEAAIRAARKTAKKPGKYEPVIARFSPNVFLGATSERFYNELEAYIAADGEQHFSSGKIDPKQFRAVMWLKYMRSLVEPGEAVGLLAAQSLGEPSTQMTLNTFHFAGFGAKNVTLGIPRLREIIMTASQKIKTPSVTVLLQPNAGDPAVICKLLSKLTLRQILQDIKVEEKLVSTTGLSAAVNLGKRARIYSITLNLIPLQECREQFNVSAQEIKEAIENDFVRVILAAIEKTVKRMKGGKELITKGSIKSEGIVSMSNSDEGKFADGEGGEEKDTSKEGSRENDDDDDDDDNGNESDSEDAKRSLRKTAEKQEKDLSEDEDQAGDEDKNEVEVSDSEMAEAPAAPFEPVVEKVKTLANKESLLAQNRMMRSYSYDFNKNTVSMDIIYSARHPKLLMLDILERHVGDVVIRQIEGIGRVFPHKDEASGQVGITTEGANIRGLLQHSHLFDLRHLYSNDIYAILQQYGVEAARATIVKEIAAVFAVYGISVDSRHLYLIADYMTSDGAYKPFNRMSMSTAPSPILQMTFETTVGFLRNAALSGDFDDLYSPSARIVLGLPVGLGTGSLELRQPVYQTKPPVLAN